MTKTGQSISFKYGTDNIYYTYDSDGNLVSMKLNGVEYYYIRNGQGDIIGLFDSTGTQIVAYTYDALGKLISTTGTLASTVGVKNPYRYRGYRYDTETGLYYLQNRYYNPEWGRFISSDTNIDNIYDPGALNFYVYCWNNPVKYKDITGNNPAHVDAFIRSVGEENLNNPQFRELKYEQTLLIMSIGLDAFPYTMAYLGSRTSSKMPMETSTFLTLMPVHLSGLQIRLTIYSKTIILLKA